MRFDQTVRAVALLEGAKGTLVFLAGFGALSLIHHDAQRLAEQMIAHLHLNPASRYPRIFIEAAANLTDARLSLLAALAGAYGSIRFVEAYGLWRERRWAEWFAVVSGTIYIPFEVYELLKGIAWLSLAALLVNILIVGLVGNTLWRKRQAQSENAG
ncbi:MAG: DUF2127 domain-containing protein [Nitrospira sp.]|nr:DUF2127 domain-containing protein [Nitrospira sp.]MDH4369896.1 DUF2127 domain-containing protein [Nitrospira sp.]MDH5497102.1 DUF2127 domain-containing protein [Nitrospira sp.]MDH5723991.1 DUF2127 domain-containing protein [Nitrospira sp.]